MNEVLHEIWSCLTAKQLRRRDYCMEALILAVLFTREKKNFVMYSQSEKPKTPLKQGEADTYLDTLRSKYTEFKMLTPPSSPPKTPHQQHKLCTLLSLIFEKQNKTKPDFIAILNTITPKVL